MDRDVVLIPQTEQPYPSQRSRAALLDRVVRRDTDTQAEAQADSAKAAGSPSAAATETVLVAAPSLVIASLVGQKGRR